MKGRAIPYSAAEMAWLEENRLLPIAEYHAGFVAAFARQDVSAVNLHSLRKRKGWKTGRTGYFEKGHETHNKGKPFPTARDHPNCRKTQFRKGQEPHNTRYLGHERISVDGYVEISVAETNPHTGYNRRYVLKHVHLWEQANGPVPDGHCLKCVDSNKLNTDPSNWELIPRAALPHLNGGRHKKRLAYDQAHPEVKPAIMAVAKIKARVRELR
jgi:hypothetical protein